MVFYIKLLIIALFLFGAGFLTSQYFFYKKNEDIIKIEEKAVWSTHSNIYLMLSIFGNATKKDNPLPLDRDALNLLLLNNAIIYEKFILSTNDDALKRSLSYAVKKIKVYVGNNPSQNCSSNKPLVVLNCELDKVIGKHPKMIRLLDGFPQG